VDRDGTVAAIGGGHEPQQPAPLGLREGALLVADADLLDTVYWEGRGMRVLTGGDEFGNLAWVESLLARLHKSDSISGDFVGNSG
jgi:hypothetical protein